MAGYHIRNIQRHPYGSFGKIKEELEEAEDAIEQNCKIMELVELSDMIAAVEGYLEKHHPGVTIDDLRTMAAITHRAFLNGGRSERN